MKRIVFLSGTGLVPLHLIDEAVVDMGPGASLARHLPWPAATPTVAAAAALSYERLPRDGRAAVAGIFGVLAASGAPDHEVLLRSTDNIRLRAWYVPGRNDAAAGPRHQLRPVGCG
jgi:hypothetical protein